MSKSKNADVVIEVSQTWAERRNPQRRIVLQSVTVEGTKGRTFTGFSFWTGTSHKKTKISIMERTIRAKFDLVPKAT
jgi:CTP:phosphocholine cytidylyltransferase-like protein